MPDWLQSLLFGAGGAVPMIGLAMWKLPSLYGDKWLQSRFDSKLEGVRHQFAELFDRKAKLHIAEYEALPKIWSMICDADGYTESLQYHSVLPMGFSDMDEAAIQLFMDENSFDDFERRTFNRAIDKEDCWSLISFRRRYTKAHDYRFDAERFINKNRIFIEDELGEKLNRLCATLFRMQRRLYEIRFVDMDTVSLGNKKEAVEKFDERRKILVADVEFLIKKRIWSANT